MEYRSQLLESDNDTPGDITSTAMTTSSSNAFLLMLNT